MSELYSLALEYAQAAGEKLLSNETVNRPYYGHKKDTAPRINSKVTTNSDLLKNQTNVLQGNKTIQRSNQGLLNNNVGVHGATGMSDIINVLDNSINLSENYLLKQKLQNTNTYSRLKSSVVFQSEFLSHVRLNQLT